MAAELFSTNLPHGSEVEVKKGFIQSSGPEPSDNGGGGEECSGTGVQANLGGSDQDDKDGWQETQPTLRER